MTKGLKKFYALVDALESLPTIGKKSAVRLAYHMLMSDNLGASKLAHAIEDGLRSITKCQQCGAMSENEICEICLDEHRDSTLLSIVENSKDIYFIEESSIFQGRYFVLDRLEDEYIKRLEQIVVSEGVKEIIFTLTPSIANDALILYIEDKLQGLNVNFTKIAQGVPTGVNLENVDMLSLSRAIEARTQL
jgi:recombination protein RecR